MALESQEINFIQTMQDEFPAKRISSGFDDLLSINPEIRVMHLQHTLKDLFKTEYLVAGVPRYESETLYEQLNHVTDMAKQVTPAHLSVDKVIDILNVHSIEKALIPQFTENDAISNEDKDQLTFLGIKVAGEAYPNMVNNWQDFQQGNSAEGRFARDLVELQTYQKTLSYQDEYPKADFTDIFENVENREWATKEGSTLFQTLYVYSPVLKKNLALSL